MHILARLVKIIFYVPILLLASPGLIILFGAILIIETDDGPLREHFFRDVNKYGFRHGFSMFMRENFIKTYKYNIQGFVVGAAGFLVVAVGLRSLGILPKEVVYVALGNEFLLLIVYGVAMFYVIDEKTETNGHKTNSQEGMATALTQMNSLLQKADIRAEKSNTLESTLKNLGETITARQMNPAETKEFNQKFLIATKGLTDHLALLESRLRMTEEKFEELSRLDASMSELSKHLELIVSDHLNSRIKKEFDLLLLQLTQRAADQAKG
ncbi:MAG: hypothetical protein ACHQQQ_09930 [Bacteroidota bacterium]